MKKILVQLFIFILFLGAALWLAPQKVSAACNFQGCSSSYPGYYYNYSTSCTTCVLGDACNGWPTYPTHYTCNGSCGAAATYSAWSACSATCNGTQTRTVYNQCGASMGTQSQNCNVGTVYSCARCSTNNPGYWATWTEQNSSCPATVACTGPSYTCNGSCGKATTYSAWSACGSCGGTYGTQGTKTRTKYNECGASMGTESASCCCGKPAACSTTYLGYYYQAFTPTNVPTCDSPWPVYPTDYTCNGSCGTCPACTPFGSCSNSCGTGTQPCDANNQCGALCYAGTSSCTVCSPADCAGYTYGSYGACSNQCGTGTKTRNRYYACNGAAAGTDSTSCTVCSPADCAGITYGSFGACSQSCGTGTQTRTATYNCSGGTACGGEVICSQSCNTSLCAAPSLDLPANGATNQSLTPVLKTTASDAELDYLRYKIQLCTDAAMTLNCQTFDQTVSQTGWSGQNTQTSTAYTSGTQGVYTVQSALTGSTTYYWRSYRKDPGGSNNWSNTQVTPYSFTTRPSACSPPTSGNYSITTPCAFANTVDGVDAGTGTTNTAVLTVGTGGSLTVLSDQTAIAVGSLSLTGGTITIIAGGSIKIGTPLYLPDADGDGYPTSVTTTQYTTAVANRARRSLPPDSDDNNAAVH